MVVRTGPLDEVTCVQRDSFVVSGPDGDVLPGGDQGFYVRDVRFLDHLEVRLDGDDALPLSGGLMGADRAVFYGYRPPAADRAVDPTLLVTRRRLVDGGLHEEVLFDNADVRPHPLGLEIHLGTDFAYIFDVKHARRLDRIVPAVEDGTIVFHRPDGVDRTVVTALVDGRPVEVEPEASPDGAVLRITSEVPARGQRRICLDVCVQDVYGSADPGQRCGGFDTAEPTRRAADPVPSLDCSEETFDRLFRRSLVDLESLALPDPDAPEDRFTAAGSPWYLTLFGRDSLWAALMALPFDPDLALGTLRTLARRQGRREHLDTEEMPGKILHEVRRGSLVERGDLPPNYYGSVDATPLFVILAHEAWRWGVRTEALEELIPNVEAALAWMRDHGDADGDGFLEYVRPGERGLANQGWKDSGDGIRFADGTVAEAPMALAEVQGYAFAAARGGAALLDAFDRPGADEWRSFARRIASRFREAFWVEDADGPYPAVALDRDKRPVDSVASNMGHLLFTGLLDRDEAAVVAGRLTSVGMNSGWGLRTLSAGSGGYNPLSYHCGSVWPHDTAIAVWGLARSGQGVAARALLDGLVAAAPTFQYRLPELFSGLPRDDGSAPVPYPASCRPQAWAAGGVLLMVRALLGLEADVPAGHLRIQPLEPAPFDRLELRDLPLAGGRVDLVYEDGAARVRVLDVDLAVEVVQRSGW